MVCALSHIALDNLQQGVGPCREATTSRRFVRLNCMLVYAHKFGSNYSSSETLEFQSLVFLVLSNRDQTLATFNVLVVLRETDPNLWGLTN